MGMNVNDGELRGLEPSDSMKELIDQLTSEECLVAGPAAEIERLQERVKAGLREASEVTEDKGDGT